MNMKLMTMNKFMNMNHLTMNDYEQYEPNFVDARLFMNIVDAVFFSYFWA